MNSYFSDASIFTKTVAASLNKDMSAETVIFSSLHLALALERVFKGLLFELNPIYVYKNQSFKNTAPILFKDKLLPDRIESEDIAKKPDHDVLAFKASFWAAHAFSNTTRQYKNSLLAIGDHRDIIAHCPLSMFELEKANAMLLRDFYPILREYCLEAILEPELFFGGDTVKVAEISYPYQEDLEQRLRGKLEACILRWNTESKIEGYKEKCDEETKKMKAKLKDYCEYECPACENPAILAYDVDYDYDPYEQESWPIGVYVTALACCYCKLKVDESEYIDHLGLNSWLREPDHFDEE